MDAATLLTWLTLGVAAWVAIDKSLDVLGWAIEVVARRLAK